MNYLCKGEGRQITKQQKESDLFCEKKYFENYFLFSYIYI
ncbi:Uncharacterised protein [Sphingobacterium spiritivorum]|uniref:Uncharacterized protein n=1 Tax=Sphingobacterium spiritivorum ATCC 33861 TaxID=525373 RepID=D7VGD7_SPHSI|nr:hypothetical protein HMPREF0766_10056 [Sphingobacterium spiritivorum ATCC 33861]SUJ01523.1 Uncharacterised protein [Sphingobacterium spiritivorum]